MPEESFEIPTEVVLDVTDMRFKKVVDTRSEYVVERVFEAMLARGYSTSTKYRILGGTGNVASGTVLFIIMALLIFYLEAGEALGLPRPF